MKYCSKCGSPINQDTHKCSGCGKQYFILNKRIAYIVIALALVVSNIFSAYIAVNNYEQVQIYKKDMALSIKEKDALVDQVKSIKDQKSEYEEKIKLELAFKTPTGEKYHRWGCPYLENANRFVAVRVTDQFPRYNQYCSYCWK